MKKWLVALAVVLLLLVGYGAAGPYLAIRGIHAAIEERDPNRLERYVDYPILRANIRVIQGYPGSREINLAMQSGEAGGDFFFFHAVMAGGRFRCVDRPLG